MFDPGSGPPSQTATVIARECFVNAWPRFASAAFFLCLIDDHLLCPDTCHLLLYELQEPLVHARVARQLGMERRDEEPPLAQKHRLAVQLREHLDARPDGAHAWRPDEDAAQRLLLAAQLQVRLETRYLAAVGVPLDLEVDEAQVVAVEQDHPGTGAEDRGREAADCLLQPVEPDETRYR